MTIASILRACYCDYLSCHKSNSHVKQTLPNSRDERGQSKYSAPQDKSPKQTAGCVECGFSLFPPLGKRPESLTMRPNVLLPLLGSEVMNDRSVLAYYSAHFLIGGNLRRRFFMAVSKL